MLRAAALLVLLAGCAHGALDEPDAAPDEVDAAIAPDAAPITPAITPPGAPLDPLGGLGAIELSYRGGAIPGALAPRFDPALRTYDVDVGLWLERVEVTVRLLAPSLEATVAGVPVVSGAPSPPIALNLALTSIPIVISGGPDAIERAAPQTYMLSVHRAPQVLQRAYAKASNPELRDAFGGAVALWGDTLAVGAMGEGSASADVGGDQLDNSAPDSGAVYVFTRGDDGAWTQQAYLKASNTQAFDHFGGALALWGDTLVVGATGEDGLTDTQFDNYGPYTGAVYVFVRDADGAWAPQAYLKASNRDRGDYFGTSLALWRDTLVIGAPREDSAATGVDGHQYSSGAHDSGAVYVFEREDGVWLQRAYVKASDTGAEDGFGISVASWGDTFAVGAFGADGDGDAVDSGAAYVFVRDPVTASWVEQARLEAETPAAGDWFGGSVDLSGDTLVVAATNDDSDAEDSGAAHVFVRDPATATWTQQAYLKATNPRVGDRFGVVSLWGDLLAVGTYGDDDPRVGFPATTIPDAPLRARTSGAAHVFLRTGDAWAYEAFLKASNADAWDAFGVATAVWADTIVVGASNESSDATGIGGDEASDAAMGAGAAYVFQ